MPSKEEPIKAVRELEIIIPFLFRLNRRGQHLVCLLDA